MYFYLARNSALEVPLPGINHGMGALILERCSTWRPEALSLVLMGSAKPFADSDGVMIEKPFSSLCSTIFRKILKSEHQGSVKGTRYEVTEQAARLMES